MDPLAIQVALIAVTVSVLTSLANKKIVNQKRMKEIKTKISDFQKKYAEAKRSNDEAALKSLGEEEKQLGPLMKEMMMNSFKPMLYTFIPLILVLVFMSNAYGNAGNIVNLPVFGPTNWFWWYFLITITVGIIFEITYKVWMKKKEKEAGTQA